jgi:hypothetical protein
VISSAPIRSAGPSNSPTEEDIDLWFIGHNINRTELRMRIQPYANSDWSKKFPRYAAGMKKELDQYEYEVQAAIKMDLAENEPPGSARCMRAYVRAGETFFTLAIAGEIDGDMLTRYSFRLALARAEAASPLLSYVLPPEDSDDYENIARLPERGFDIPLPSHVQAALTSTTSASSSLSSTGVGRGVRGRGCPRGRPRGSGRGRAKGAVLGMLG